MRDIFDETQEERDEEIARYLGIQIDDVRACEINDLGPVVHNGKHFRAKSYNFLYENLGRERPAPVLRMLSRFNVTKRAHLIRGALKYIGHPGGMKVLDFGCGPGGHGIHFLQRGARVDFLDVVGPVYNFAKWRVKTRRLANGARFFAPDTKLAPSFYDVVLCVDVLEHVADPLRVLDTLVRATKPNGFFLLQIGYHPNPRQGHFKQSIGRIRTVRCQKYIKRTLVPMEPAQLTKAQNRRCFYFRRR